MKKTLAAAITSALVIGVASTTFAAANPFSDVPTDHWSFDAVAKLAHEGVIEGYGDNTFRGDAKITRYEMAQMVAKAMAKTDVSAADKATIDKLSAEYADELNNLGVRVAALEKKTDNVKFTGEARFRFNQDKIEPTGESSTKYHQSLGLFRLNASAQVNDQWTANARLDSELDTDASTSASTSVDRVWAQGPLFGATAKLGKFGSYSAQGYVLDDPISGAEFQWKGKALTTTITAARINDSVITKKVVNVVDGDQAFNGGLAKTTAADYEAIDFNYALSAKTNVGVAYHHLGYNQGFDETNGVSDTNNIFTFAAATKFDSNWGLKGVYAKSSLDVENDNGYSVELDYKGASVKNPGSYGVWVAYRDVPYATAISNTWNGARTGAKGYEVGANYTFDKNILGTVAYFDGEQVDSTNVDRKFFRGQVEFFF